MFHLAQFTMAHYTFDIVQYKLVTSKGKTYKNFIKTYLGLPLEQQIIIKTKKDRKEQK